MHKEVKEKELKEERSIANISTQHSNTGLTFREHRADSKWMLVAPSHQDTGL